MEYQEGVFAARIVGTGEGWSGGEEECQDKRDGGPHMDRITMQCSHCQAAVINMQCVQVLFGF